MPEFDDVLYLCRNVKLEVFAKKSSNHTQSPFKSILASEGVKPISVRSLSAIFPNMLSSSKLWIKNICTISSARENLLRIFFSIFVIVLLTLIATSVRTDPTSRSLAVCCCENLKEVGSCNNKSAHSNYELTSSLYRTDRVRCINKTMKRCTAAEQSTS